MHTDTYGQLIFTENELCDLILRDPEKFFNNIIADTEIIFDEALNLTQTPTVRKYTDPKVSVAEFDNINQNNWHMPSEYRELDIAKWVLEQCHNDSELQRAGQELLLFQERDMFNLLRYMKYLVDTMRNHNIVWGVGRGSSVASFVLYLIGIHKINSWYFDLSIEEFLK